MLVAGLFRHDRIPQDPLRRLRHRPPEKIGEFDAALGDDCHLFIAKEHDGARVAQNRRNVGGDEEFSVAETDHDRRPVAHCDDLVGIVGRDQHEREESAHQQQRPPHGVLEAVVFHFALDQMRDDFRVGLGDEGMALELELGLQIQVVLDDPVVHDDDLAGAVSMRMGVFFSGTAVRRPARMTDAVITRDR